jgi:hypothetical protein
MKTDINQTIIDQLDIFIKMAEAINSGNLTMAKNIDQIIRQKLIEHKKCHTLSTTFSLTDEELFIIKKNRTTNSSPI